MAKMAKRSIVSIDEKKCNGCGLCIPNCAEGALKIVNGKAKLSSDVYCDGLGACLGHCPRGAITIVERSAKGYDEKAVHAHLKEVSRLKKELNLNKKSNPKWPKINARGNKIEAAAQPKGGEPELPCGCPGSATRQFKSQAQLSELGGQSESEEACSCGCGGGEEARAGKTSRVKSEITTWPVQLKLVPPNAPYFANADLLVAADCVPFAYANFHADFLKGKPVVIACPKLDDAAEAYTEKLAEIIKMNKIKSITLVNMEVPCCFGLQRIVEEAVAKSGRAVPIRQFVISVEGERRA